MKPYILLLLFMAFRLAGIGQSFNPSITCPNDTAVLLGDAFALSGGLPTGGVYSGPGVLPGGESFNSNVAGLGTHTITYTFNGESCEFIINVVNQFSISCPNDTLACLEVGDESWGLIGYPVGGIFSGNGVEALPGTTTYRFNKKKNNVVMGENIITYKTNGLECTSVFTVLNIPDKPVLISPITSACIGDTVVYEVTPVPYAKEYLWTLSDMSLTDFSTGLNPKLQIIFTKSFENGDLFIKVNNGCKTAQSDAQVITVHSLPNPLIDGKASVCQNEQTEYISEIGFTDYNWTIEEGIIDSIFANTIIVTWDTNSIVGSVVLQVTDNNGCKNSNTKQVAKDGRTPDVPEIWLFGSRLLVCSLNDNDISYKWFYKNPEGGYQVIDNSKQYYYVPDVNLLDTFKVQACYGLCCNESELYPKQGHIKSALTPSLLSIYPNPTHDLVTLKLLLPLQESYKYRLVDVYGGLQLEGSTNELELQLNLTTLKSGIYFLQVQSPTLGIENYKILKTN